jgi:hypothetical protein
MLKVVDLVVVVHLKAQLKVEMVVQVEETLGN